MAPMKTMKAMKAMKSGSKVMTKGALVKTLAEKHEMKTKHVMAPSSRASTDFVVMEDGVQ